MASFRKIAVLGAGLIGGSVLRAAARRKIAGSLSAYDPLEKADALPGVIAAPDPAAAVREADLVLLCAPMEAMADSLHAALPGLSPDAIVTDVGSVKQPVEEALAPLLRGKARWVGGHPVAGREKRGFAAGDAALFEGAAVLLTPTAETDPQALRRVTGFWEALGGRVRTLSPEAHDREMARLSHAVHVAAAAVMRLADGSDLSSAGPGLRDTTRIAAGPAALWEGILAANRVEVIAALDFLTADLARFRALLAEKKETELHDWLRHANELRGALEKASPQT